MLEHVLELRPRAVAVLDCHDVLRVAQLEALMSAFAERLMCALKRLGLADAECAQQLLGVLPVVLEFHDVLLRLRPASASSGGERDRHLDVTLCCPATRWELPFPRTGCALARARIVPQRPTVRSGIQHIAARHASTTASVRVAPPKQVEDAALGLVRKIATSR
jgi:hypothetical protein